jgi:predicted metal-dependent phosphoesterase TrpH
VFKGVLHVHSVYSDGDETLDRLIEIFRQSGMMFAAVTDHAEVFDDIRMHRYVEHCQALSRANFVVIPGLEFAFPGGGIHILGYGITKRVYASDMEKLVDGIHEAGGIAVLAHPPTGCTNLIASVKAKLDGIEVWNGRYDGVHAPRVDSFQLFRRIRATNLKAIAFGGIDLHKAGQAQRPIYLEVAAEELSRNALMTSLRHGKFTVRGANITIPATGELTFIQELSIAVKQPLCRRWAG